MKLNLFRKTTIADVKRQFAKCFPYLKLEVFSLPHTGGKGSLTQQPLDDSLSLSQIKTFHSEGTLSFQPSMTTDAFKSLLQKEFGLAVQVFRRSGDLSLETIGTYYLSLESQNAMSEAACRPMCVNLATLFL
ncbi:MAG: hypothetical protein ACJ75B_21245 [Flavisolibacter sp.]